ncbi:hypothetical protein [Serratia entomophila]|uniref:hypothetical protein n=1 Tax=Serratia entomophila TaxID=42906 RepID=UPI0021BAEA20|nr:hypothetical protein [Serratia entomophila]
MEGLSSLLSLISDNKIAVTIISTTVTTLAGIYVYFLKQRAERRAQRYVKTLEYYESFSCQLFACMDMLCQKIKLSGQEMEYLSSDDTGQPAWVKGTVYQALLCGAGRATLVASPCTRELIVKFIQNIVHNKDAENDRDACLEQVSTLVNAMNAHLHTFEYSCFRRLISGKC